MRWIVMVVFLIGAIAWPAAPASAQRRGGMRMGLPPDDSRVAAEIDRGVQQAMNDAQQLLKQEQYVPAVIRLQSILDHPEDYFLRKDFRTKTTPIPTVKSQTNRILSELPAEGRTAYELHFGTAARALLTEAVSTNDVDKLAEVVSRYQMTAAGFEAMQMLAASAFDHDQPFEAAMLCEAMAARPVNDRRLTGTLLLRAAFAWHLAGQTERSLSALNSLKALNDASLWRIGGRRVSPLQDARDASEWLTTHFGSPMKPHLQVMRDWSMPRGGLTGNESAMTACPAGGGAWMVSSLQHTRFLIDDDANQQRQEALDQLTRQIEKTLREDNRLAQPCAIPIVVGDVVVYRTLNDITAVSLQTGQLMWRSSVTDGMLSWLSQSPTADADNANASSPMSLPGYLRHKLFRDQISGSLTSDGRNVYAIEESDSQFSPLRPRVRQQFGGQFIADPANKLVAYELEGGRLLWEIGGLRGTPPVELSGIYFLGPPLPFAGRLYCLAEVKDELVLLCLVPEATSARLEWSQTLIAVTDGDWIASPRRLAGVIPAIADGIIVCSTASGSVVAFDLLQRQLQWGYSYEPLRKHNWQDGFELLQPFQVDEEEGRWLEGGPLLAKGRVVITPRDSGEIHCLNLVDGGLVWKRAREQGLYVAFINDDVVYVVGRTQIVAYSLVDGTDLWAEPLEIPEPSGRGIRDGLHYLLPLSTGEIATLDLSTGRILGRSRLPEGYLPGNLAVGSGSLVSCGTHNVIGFRSLVDVERKIAIQLKANPRDAEALALRGELRLHHGEEEGAINDLRESLQQQPQSRVKRVLAGTMLTVLKNDSPRLLKAATELESLTEEPRQRMEFLRLYAKSLSDAGDRVGAVKQLFRLAAIPELPDEPIASSPGYFISLEPSIRSQLLTVYEAANSSERMEIDRAFAREFEAAVSAKDRELRLMRFVKLTVGHPAADPLLKHLVESKDEIADETARTSLLEQLTKSRNRSIAAFAVAKLAARSLSANLPRQAWPWIEELGQDFPSEICLNGKTGRQISDEWLSRDDVRPKQIETASWPEGPIEVERFRRRVELAAAYPVDVVTHVGHYFVDWSFELDPRGNALTARDPSSRIAWRFPLANSIEPMRVQPAQLHIRGQHLAFSTAMSLVVMKSTDPYVAPKFLFEKSLRSSSLVDRRPNQVLAERHLLPTGRRFQSAFDARGPAGFLIGLSNEAVIYQLDNRLFAVDAETGRVLWFRVGAEFAKSNGTVDRTLTLHTINNDAVLLRPLDGAILQRHKGGLDEMPLWFGGTRRLSKRSEGLDAQILEMRDFDGDKIVWQMQHPSGTLTSVIDSQELAVLEPSGRFTILKLASGEVKLTTELPITRPHGSGGELAVQRSGDRYVIVGGVSSKKTDSRTVTTLEFGPASDTSFTVDGYACAIDRSDGRIAWSVPVEQLAFDFAQPANIPVLVLASRHSDSDRLGQFNLQRLSALILDRRTGQTVYQKEESLMLTGRGVQFIPMIDDRKLVIDFQAWNLELTFPNEAK